MKTILSLLFWTVLSAGLSCAADSSPPRSPTPAERVLCVAGDLHAVVRSTTNGLELERLWDASTQTTLATNAAPLFSLVLRHAATKKERTVTASEGWRETRLRKTRSGLELRWGRASDEVLAGLAVQATARTDAPGSALRWTFQVDNRTKDWSVRRVLFPQLSLADLGDHAAVLFPRGPGEVQRNVWRRDFHYRGNYPDGWCCMQFMAAYREGAGATGLYVGLHDPWGSTKHLELKSAPTSRVVRLAFELPASDLNRAGNDFTLSGEAVWQLLRGDWFDAARLYKTWAQKEARWWPRLARDGRADTPPWMRELSAWVMTGGAPGECVPGVKRFRETLGLPVGFHWYNWHQIPFDNDYPHYFPTKTNFARGVAELQQAGVFVMPYINGRLWDSKDRGAEDFEFSRLALAAATKQESGEPYLESYGSKETNGQPVRLAVMCPTTRLWQDRVRGIVRRLQRDEGTRGVYIDQVAAAAPTLCMDLTHGHPLGGGHWWTEGYWDLLQGIRREMPRDRMLTTECNGEPFIRWFDGYLTWHWQHDGQVPAFPAVYGGTIQMFGRAYRGGATRDLALRMKAGQQLAFGEQIGWFDPAQASEPQNLEFLRKAILTRWNFRRYFHAGEMARPPKLSGEMPAVKADWQWSGEWWVTTDAVLTGAWQLPKEHTLVLLFANVSDNAVTAELPFDGRAYDLTATSLHVDVLREKEGVAEQFTVPNRFQRVITFPARSLFAWEIR